MKERNTESMRIKGKQKRLGREQKKKNRRVRKGTQNKISKLRKLDMCFMQSRA
jgi:hypothetical protein